jgi:hypothetical protein
MKEDELELITAALGGRGDERTAHIDRAPRLHRGAGLEQ